MSASSNGSRNYACRLYQECLDFWARRNAPSLPCSECDLGYSRVPPPTDKDTILGCISLLIAIESNGAPRDVVKDAADAYLHDQEDEKPCRVPIDEPPISEWSTIPVEM